MPVNPAELFVARHCEGSFLSLWGMSNPVVELTMMCLQRSSQPAWDRNRRCAHTSNSIG
jgi:hypothetical protein